MLYVKCPKCGIDIAISREKYASGLQQEIFCRCGSKMLIKKPVSFKNALIKTGKITGKVAKHFLAYAMKTYEQDENAQSKAYERLEKRNFEDWDEERIKKEYENSDVNERKAILLKLKELSTRDDV